jgi:hypothetical protein
VDEFLTDGYDTFGECWGWGTPAHGWSSTPVKDVIVHLLGIAPAEPGFASARIAPAYGAAAALEGVAPTPYGPIRVTVDGDDVAVDSPVPFELVGIEGTAQRLPATRAAEHGVVTEH